MRSTWQRRSRRSRRCRSRSTRAPGARSSKHEHEEERHMKVAMHNWMRAEPVETTIRRLAKFGYDGIEISYDSVELSPGAPGTKAVRQMLKDNGISCYGSISLMFTGRDLMHADPAVRASSVEYLKNCITMIKELEGQVMSIVPSEVG